MHDPLKHVSDLYRGFLAHADEHGHLRCDNPKHTEQLASLLGLEIAIMKDQMNTMDSDHNGIIGFAEFALWSDRHTRSIALGLDVPPKESWQDGCPSHWTSMPPKPPPEDSDDFLPSRTRGSGRGSGPLFDTEEMCEKLHRLLDYAKFRCWDELLPQLEMCSATELNFRPPLRQYGIIHHVAETGSIDFMKRIVHRNADVLATTKGGANALHIAKKHGRDDMVEFLESLISGADTAVRKDMEHKVLTAAKEGTWDVVFAKLDFCPDLVNARPAERVYAIIHHAACVGDEALLQRLVENYNADVQLRTKPTEEYKNGQTALQIALEHHHDMAATYLESVMPALHLHDDFITFPKPQLVRVTDVDLLSRFHFALADLHKPTNNWTRDRQGATNGVPDPNKVPVPTGYTFVAAFRNENAALWRMYQIQREVIKDQCQGIHDFARWKPWTSGDPPYGGTKAFEGRKEFELMADANEWLLFHASIPEALKGIAETGFKMAKVKKGADSAGGGLYGEGVYLSDSITKADEYARKRISGGEFDGCRAAALVRVTGGHVLRVLHDVKQEDKAGFCKKVFEDKFHSVLGDRLRLRGTYREYVAYSAPQCYLEYIIYYKREGIEHKYQ